MPKVGMASERSIVRPVRQLVLFRYKLISWFYLTFFSVTLASYVACTVVVYVSVDDEATTDSRRFRLLTRLVTLFSVGTGSGGVGYFLVRLDQREQENANYQQALEVALERPEGPSKDELIKSVISRSVGIHSAPATQPPAKKPPSSGRRS